MQVEVRIILWCIRDWFLVNAHRVRKRSREQIVISNCKATDDLREGCDLSCCKFCDIGYMAVVREN
jgi:hypothetical protein